MMEHLHPLHSVFHPSWTPSDDGQLLALRDKGISFDRIALAQMRRPKAVMQRWHRLRVVPGIRGHLRRFSEKSAEYPVEQRAGVILTSGVVAP